MPRANRSSSSFTLGVFWLNLRGVLDFHPRIAEKVDGIYSQLEAHASHFKAQDRTANLLISSSTAMVPYHLDMPVNMLWHIRGKKRVWVYPHFDYRFVARSVVEKVCAGELSEDVPYDPFFDNFALTFDVEPGQLLTWPQLTPHPSSEPRWSLCVTFDRTQESTCSATNQHA